VQRVAADPEARKPAWRHESEVVRLFERKRGDIMPLVQAPQGRPERRPEVVFVATCRDLAGWIGQRTAAAADETWLLIAGCPARLER
jgi:hypothetical protein